MKTLIRGELTKTEKVELEKLNNLMQTSDLYSDKERKQLLLLFINTITLQIRPKKQLR